MLDWKKHPEGNPEFEVVTLTEENLPEVVTFLLREGKAVSGDAPSGTRPDATFLAVNGVEVPEGGRIFKRLSDGVVGTLPPKKAEGDA